MNYWQAPIFRLKYFFICSWQKQLTGINGLYLSDELDDSEVSQSPLSKQFLIPVDILYENTVIITHIALGLAPLSWRQCWSATNISSNKSEAS